MRNPNTEPNADAAAKSEERPAVKKPLKGKVVGPRARERISPAPMCLKRIDVKSPPRLYTFAL